MLNASINVLVIYDNKYALFSIIFDVSLFQIGPCKKPKFFTITQFCHLMPRTIWIPGQCFQKKILSLLLYAAKLSIYSEEETKKLQLMFLISLFQVNLMNGKTWSITSKTIGRVVIKYGMKTSYSQKFTFMPI